MRAGSLGPGFQLVGDSTLLVLSLAILGVGGPSAMKWRVVLAELVLVISE